MLWKTRVPGSGWSSPVVAGGRVWVTAADQGPEPAARVSLRVLAFDAETGREVVNVEVFRIRNAGFINVKNSRASPTPIVDGDRVYVHFGADGTAALTTSGEIVWKAGFPYESQHGNGGSPVLYGDLLIFSCDGFDQAFVVALDKQTGKVRWKNVAPPALGPGLFDAARDSRRRSGSARQRRARIARPRTIRCPARRSGA